MTVRILRGDVMRFAAHYKGPLMHAILCDPPYELGFMSKAWDAQGVSFRAETWAALSSLLHPGAHLLAFGGTRTYHRIACAIEDAGFEIRDCMQWIYGSGFPKSHNVSKAIDREAGAERETIESRWASRGLRLSGWKRQANENGAIRTDTAPATPAAVQWDGYGSALKPAYEPICVARKPLVGTLAANVQACGCGALNVDGCRVEAEPELAKNWNRSQSREQGISSTGLKAIDLRGYTPAGRWPANVIIGDAATAMRLDEMSGESVSKRSMRGVGLTNSPVYGRGDSDYDTERGHSDTGGASRFFYNLPQLDDANPFYYSAKASRRERDAGLEGMQERGRAEVYGDGFSTATKCDPAMHTPEGVLNRTRVRNHHPTVKPIALTEYLARLILPPPLDVPRRILIPFAGVMSEAIGAMRAGWDEVVGVEMDQEYVDIARARVRYWQGLPAEWITE